MTSILQRHFSYSILVLHNFTFIISSSVGYYCIRLSFLMMTWWIIASQAKKSYHQNFYDRYRNKIIYPSAYKNTA